MPLSIVIQNNGPGVEIRVVTTNLFDAPIGPEEDGQFHVLSPGEHIPLTVDDGESILIKELSPHPGGYSEPKSK